MLFHHILNAIDLFISTQYFSIQTDPLSHISHFVTWGHHAHHPLDNYMAPLLNSDMCNPDFLLGQIGRSRSLPLHIIPIRIIRILPNPDRNLGYTSVRIKQSCMYLLAVRQNIFQYSQLDPNMSYFVSYHQWIALLLLRSLYTLPTAMFGVCKKNPQVNG